MISFCWIPKKQRWHICRQKTRIAGFERRKSQRLSFSIISWVNQDQFNSSASEKATDFLNVPFVDTFIPSHTVKALRLRRGTPLTAIASQITLLRFSRVQHNTRTLKSKPNCPLYSRASGSGCLSLFPLGPFCLFHIRCTCLSSCQNDIIPYNSWYNLNNGKKN